MNGGDVRGYEIARGKPVARDKHNSADLLHRRGRGDRAP